MSPKAKKDTKGEGEKNRFWGPRKEVTWFCESRRTGPKNERKQEKLGVDPTCELFKQNPKIEKVDREEGNKHRGILPRTCGRY